MQEGGEPVAAPITEELENRLLNQPVVNTDGTVVSVNGIQSFIRNISSWDTVIYEPLYIRALAK